MPSAISGRGAARRHGRRGARPRRGSATSAARSRRRRTATRIRSHAPAPRRRVEPGRRLVEEQQVGVADDAEGEVEAPALAAGEAVAALVDGLVEPDQLEALLGGRASCSTRRTGRTSPTVSTRSIPEDCRTMPIRSRKNRSASAGSQPSTETSPEVRAGNPRGSPRSSSCRLRSRREGRRPPRLDVNEMPSTAGTSSVALDQVVDGDDAGTRHVPPVLNDGEVIGRPVSLRRCSAVGRK